MVFPIVGGNQATGDLITNSARFEDGDSPDLRFDGQMAAGNRRTFTYSFWTKRGNLGINTCVFSVEASDVVFRFGTSDDIQFKDVNNDSFNLSTNNVFRDTSAWYHIVVAVDTTDGTAANRIKLYVNGTQQTTDFGTASYPSQNHDTEQNNNGDSMYIGARTDSTTEGNSMQQHYDGYIAYFHLIDGQQLDSSYFGETNDNGVWIPKKYTGSYGTNGFLLEYKQTGTSANASGIGADTSGNDNHFTPTNLAAIDITTDTPQNNFATANPLGSNASAFAEGNTKTTGDTGTSYSLGASSSIGFKSGKWYMEFKVSDVGNNTYIGLMKDGNHLSVNGDYQYPLGNLFYRHDGDKLTGSGSGFGVDTTYGDTFTDNDIIGVAADMDNRNLYFYKNGTIQNSGTAAFTSSLISSTAGSSIEDDTYYFFFTAGYNDSILFHNYGQPSFSISSGNTDANGYGNFEYAVPSGYYSLCTKNLAEFG